MKNIKKSFIKMTLFGFIILVVFSVFVHGQASVSVQSLQVSGVIRDLWEKLGSSIFPANPSWNVGIGTNNPQAKLDVNGSMAVGSMAVSGKLDVFQTGSQGSPSVRIGDQGGNGLFDPGNNALAIATDGVERLRLDNTGNLGIGTQSPSARLDVAGNAKFSGSVETPNYISVGSSTGTIYMAGFSNQIQKGIGAWDFISGGIPIVTFTDSGSVGISTMGTAKTKLQVAGGDGYFSTAGTGVILRSPDGFTCRRIGIDNGGSLTVSPVACP